MKKRLSMITIALCVVVLGGSVCATPTNASVDVPYEYPITPYSEQWASFSDLNEMVEACRIPEDILNSMSTEALIITLKNFPLLTNYYAYDKTKAPQRIKEQSDAYAELLTRNNVEDAYNNMVRVTENGGDTSFENEILRALLDVNVIDGN